jgi:heme exporter protein A
MVAIQTANLSKSYGHYRVFEDLSFEVFSGECFVLFGPNGAGKTTLLHILATLNRPTSGCFKIFGIDGMIQKEAVRKAVMLLAHGSYLYDDLNAYENLKFSMAMRGEMVGDLEMKRALDQVEIGAFGEMKTRYFSAGMKKRLTLAKAILAKPKVLLLDEPYNALDAEGVTLMNGFIKDILRNNGAVFMTTHDQEKASKVSHRTGILSQGTLLLPSLAHPEAQ